MPGPLDAATRAVIAQALDDILLPADEGGLGKRCRLVYPPRFAPCPNCVFDPVGNRSSGRYKAGGPAPFAAGQPCPVCQGEGKTQTAATEDLVLGVTWEPKAFVRPLPANVDLRTPHATCQTRGFLRYAPKLAKCDHLIVDVPVEGLLRQKMRLAGEVSSPGNIIQGRYCVATWTRFNG